MSEAKICPECNSDNVYVDSTWCASWVQCNDCEFKIQHECSEEAVVKLWNKIKRNKTKNNPDLYDFMLDSSVPNHYTEHKKANTT